MVEFGIVSIRYAVAMVARDRSRLPWFENEFMALAHAKTKFIELLTRYTTQGRHVSHNPGPTYAPTQFAKDPAANGIRRDQFMRAMNSLFGENRLKVVTHGRLGKERSHLALV